MIESSLEESHKSYNRFKGHQNQSLNQSRVRIYFDFYFTGDLLKEMVTRMQEKLKCYQNGNQGNECQTIGDLKFYAYSAVSFV